MSFSIKNGDSEVSEDFSMLQDLIKDLESDYYVDIGILGSEMDAESGLTIAGIGLTQEVGTTRAGKGNRIVIPGRSFIKMPLTEKAGEIQKSVEGRMPKHLEDGNVEGIFKDIGIAGEAAIQEAFDTKGFGSWAPNASLTIEGSKPNKEGEQFIKGKGSNAPLINDGTLRKTITSKVGK